MLKQTGIVIVLVMLTMLSHAQPPANHNIHIVFPDGVPLSAQGQIEVDIRTWRSEETTTLTMQVPVLDDPAPQVTFDPLLGDTLNLQVGEALKLPLTITDPGHNTLRVEYLLNGIPLQTQPQTLFPLLEPGVEINGSLQYAGNGVYNAAYYSLVLEQETEITIQSFNTGVLGDVLYIFRDDGDLTVDDLVGDFYPFLHEGDSITLPSGNFIVVLTHFYIETNYDQRLNEIVGQQPVSCDASSTYCPEANLDYTLLIDRRSTGDPIPVNIGDIVEGTLMFEGLSQVENGLYDAQYYSFSVPAGFSNYIMVGIYHLIPDASVARLNLSVYVFVDDGDLTADDLTGVFKDGDFNQLVPGNYIAAVTADTSASGDYVDEVAGMTPHECVDCGQGIDLDFELIIDEVTAE